MLLISYVLTGETYSGSLTMYTKTKRYNTTWHLAFQQRPVSPYRVTNESWMPRNCSESKRLHLSNIGVNRNIPWKEVAMFYLRICDYVSNFRRIIWKEELWCLTHFSTIFQLFRGGHIMSYRVCLVWEGFTLYERPNILYIYNT